jgi:hypothetical protein
VIRGMLRAFVGMLIDSGGGVVGIGTIGERGGLVLEAPGVAGRICEEEGEGAFLAVRGPEGGVPRGVTRGEGGEVPEGEGRNCEEEGEGVFLARCEPEGGVPRRRGLGSASVGVLGGEPGGVSDEIEEPSEVTSKIVANLGVSIKGLTGGAVPI